jgi:hypothetical protein
MPATPVDNAYFSPDGEFAMRYGTSMEAPAVGEYILQAIASRDPEKIQQFENVLYALQAALEKDAAAQTIFFKMLDELRAEGLVEMVMRRAAHLEYHTVEHAAELADDVECALKLEYAREDTADSKHIFLQKFFVALARAMAAWHDVVQHNGSPQNEIDSIADFDKRLQAMLKEFSLQFPALAQISKEFTAQIPFLGKELILHPTCLIWGKVRDTSTAKTLNQYIDLSMQELSDIRYSKNSLISNHPLWKYLTLAADITSRGDTKRYAFPHVFQQHALLRGLQKLPQDEKKILEDFFRTIGITEDNDKEIFLGLFSQNIRIFTELNQPHEESVSSKCRTNITAAQHRRFIEIYDSLRAGDNVQVDYLDLITVFVQTKDEHGKNNIEREENFALALQDPMWSKHAVQLGIFSNFVANLSPGDKARFMRALTVIAIVYQPGNFLLKADKIFQKKLASRVNIVNPDKNDYPGELFKQTSWADISEQGKNNLEYAAKRFL